MSQINSSQSIPQPKRGRGRPPGSTKAAEIKAQRVNLSMPPDLAAKLKLLGGAKWVQAQIRKAVL